MAKEKGDSNYNQGTIYNSFVRECIRDLKKGGYVYAFHDYQIKDIQKAFPNDIIKVQPVHNYYVLSMERR